MNFNVYKHNSTPFVYLNVYKQKWKWLKLTEIRLRQFDCVPTRKNDEVSLIYNEFS